MPKYAAIIAFRMPTGRNGISPVIKAVFQEMDATNFNHAIPNPRVITIPNKLAKMACVIVKPFLSSQYPVRNAAGMNPNK